MQATRLFLDFNPRTHKECDWRISSGPYRPPYFNPRTHKECDLARVSHLLGTDLFQSTHSQGVRRKPTNTRLSKLKISIHALTRSATDRQRADQSADHYFNPRTHKECDANVKARKLKISKNFNPRTHKECDWPPACRPISGSLFQSTHSQGVLPKKLCCLFCVFNFNPRTHKECDVLLLFS